MRRIKDERLAWAEAKLLECRKIALRYFGTRLKVEHKPDHSPVTIADRTIEERVRRQIERAFPGEVIVGEEFGASSEDRSSYWTIDPIDGTRPFSKGLPTWGHLLGYVERGKPVMGVAVYPTLDTVLAIGQKTAPYERVNGRTRPIARARRVPSLEKAVVFHGGSKWWINMPYEAGFRKLVKTCYLERAYGDCHGYLWLFRGKVDAVIEYGVKVWDMVPFAAMGAATGRVMTDFSARPCFTGPETLLAPPSLGQQISRLLNEAQ